MNLNDTIQWFYKADNDYDAAKILNASYKKHTDIICYLCSQSVEKLLKGYLVYKNQQIEKTHNLLLSFKMMIKRWRKQFNENDVSYAHDYGEILAERILKISKTSIQDLFNELHKIKTVSFLFGLALVCEDYF